MHNDLPYLVQRRDDRCGVLEQQRVERKKVVELPNIHNGSMMRDDEG